MVKKTIGVLLILIGLLALVTPFKPGSWLVFVGLEFFGLRLAFWDRMKLWFSRKAGSRPAGQKRDPRQTK